MYALLILSIKLMIMCRHTDAWILIWILLPQYSNDLSVLGWPPLAPPLNETDLCLFYSQLVKNQNNVAFFNPHAIEGLHNASTGSYIEIPEAIMRACTWCVMPQLLSVQIADTTVTLSFSDYLPQELLWPCICSSEKLWWQKSPPASRTCSHHLRFNLSLYGNWYNLKWGDVGLTTRSHEDRERTFYTMCFSLGSRKISSVESREIFSMTEMVFCIFYTRGKSNETLPTFQGFASSTILWGRICVHAAYFSRYLQGATCLNPR